MEDNTTRMVCDGCAMQFDTNHPNRWGADANVRNECPNPSCHSQRVHPVG